MQAPSRTVQDLIVAVLQARSKAWVCGRSLAGNAGSNPAGLWMSVVCCQVEAYASGRSLVRRSPTECGVCVCVCVIVKPRYKEALSHKGS